MTERRFKTLGQLGEYLLSDKNPNKDKELDALLLMADGTLIHESAVSDDITNMLRLFGTMLQYIPRIEDKIGLKDTLCSALDSVLAAELKDMVGDSVPWDFIRALVGCELSDEVLEEGYEVFKRDPFIQKASEQHEEDN